MNKRTFLTVFLAAISAVFAAAQLFSSNANAVSDGSQTAMFTTDISDGTGYWPLIESGFSYYEPAEVTSEDEAISNIRSSQGYVYISGYKPYDVITDHYSAIYKIQWTEVKTGVDEVPTSGGFFIGWDYIPTWSKTEQIYHTTEQKQDNMTVVFKDINAIYFYKNNLCLQAPGVVNYIAAVNADSLKTLADSFYTMALNNGAKIDTEVNFRLVPLDEKQCARLKIDSGEMVISLLRGSEGARAGIKEGDIILNMQGIRKAGSFRKFFKDGNVLRILRWNENGSVINYKNIEIKLKGGK